MRLLHKPDLNHDQGGASAQTEEVRWRARTVKAERNRWHERCVARLRPWPGVKHRDSSTSKYFLPRHALNYFTVRLLTFVQRIEEKQETK